METRPVKSHQEEELLKKIRLKEEEIEKSLLEFKMTSERRVDSERARSQEDVKKARLIAEKEAKEYEISRKKTISALTDKLLNEAKTQSNLIQQEAVKNFQKAHDMILSEILPHLARETSQKTNVALGISS